VSVFSSQEWLQNRLHPGEVWDTLFTSVKNWEVRVIRSLKTVFERYVDGLSRRDLFRRGSVLAAAPAFFGRPASAAPAAPGTRANYSLPPENIYQSFGVRPLINCRGLDRNQRIASSCRKFGRQ